LGQCKYLLAHEARSAVPTLGSARRG
jgi:hypothetical protein